MQTDTLIYIGRFQPFHRGHRRVVRHGLARAGSVLLIMGSAHAARNAKNPWTVAEREALIRASLTPEENSRVQITAVPDFYDDEQWVAAVRETVKRNAVGSLGLLGHFKDESSYYLNKFPGWPIQEVPNFEGLNATDIREAWYQNCEDLTLAASMAPGTIDFLRDFRKSATFARLQTEHRAVQKYKEAWALAPYAPTFVTADAVVLCAGKVLLVRREGPLGAGLLALPGGFLEPRERLLQAALRELHEETSLDLLPAYIQTRCRGEAVFDHPDRSLRGRTITHAFFFDLDEHDTPPVKSGSDATSVHWVDVQELRAMREEFFEDHFQILEVMLPKPVF